MLSLHGQDSYSEHNIIKSCLLMNRKVCLLTNGYVWHAYLPDLTNRKKILHHEELLIQCIMKWISHKKHLNGAWLSMSVWSHQTLPNLLKNPGMKITSNAVLTLQLFIFCFFTVLDILINNCIIWINNHGWSISLFNHFTICWGLSADR